LISKSLGSTNKVNIAYAVVEGLRQQVPRKDWTKNQSAKNTVKTEKADAKKESKKSASTNAKKSSKKEDK